MQKGETAPSAFSNQRFVHLEFVSSHGKVSCFHKCAHLKICTGPGNNTCKWLRECCRQTEAEVVSNSRNQPHQTKYHFRAQYRGCFKALPCTYVPLCNAPLLPDPAHNLFARCRCNHYLAISSDLCFPNIINYLGQGYSFTLTLVSGTKK